MTRRPTITQRIEKSETGLNGALYVHVELEQGRVHEVRFSYKWKDDSGLDQVFRALSDATTEAVREAQG